MLKKVVWNTREMLDGRYENIVLLTDAERADANSQGIYVAEMLMMWIPIT